MEDMAHLVEDRQAGVRIAAVQCQVHRQAAGVIAVHRLVAAITALLQAADRTEAILEAGLQTMGIRHPDMTIITDRFSPRFTSHLTHRQEASEGASCPPRKVGLGNGFGWMCCFGQSSFLIWE
jgi:hypothetical protein